MLMIKGGERKSHGRIREGDEAARDQVYGLGNEEEEERMGGTAHVIGM